MDLNKNQNTPPSPLEKTIIEDEYEKAVLNSIDAGKWGKYGRVAMAALGSLPWIGSLLGATVTLSAEKDQGDLNKLMFLWVKEHGSKLKEVGSTLHSIFDKFESFGERIKSRIESKEYLSLVRKAFKAWDNAETSDKKDMLRKLLTNAGGVTICSDDLIQVFIEWIQGYNEFHFLVIREVKQNPNITRRGIWMNIRGSIPADSSPEADLFKLLIDDLTQGRVIRQVRDIDHQGQYIKKPRSKSLHTTSNTMKSPFDDVEPYVLTGLGEEFVVYVLNELTLQIT